MDRFGRIVSVSRNCIVPLLIVLVLAGSSYGGLTTYTDFASFDAVTVTTVVEDFESVSPKDYAFEPSFTSNGNTYTGLAGVPNPNVWVSSPGYTNFGVPYPTESSILTANGNEDFTVDFGSPTTVMGFDTYLNRFGPATIEVYGSASSLGTFSLSHDFRTVGFFGVVSDELIYGFRWTTIGGSVVNTGIDNIRQGEVVPAPGAIVLCTIGTGLVGWFGRRRGL